MDKVYRLFKIKTKILDDCKNTGIIGLKILTPKTIIEYIQGEHDIYLGMASFQISLTL